MMRVLDKRAFPIVAFLCICASQIADAGPTWFARSWQTDDGFPQNTVSGIAQTPDGYLWLGTPSSLVNFDGAQFHRFALTNAVYQGNRGVVTLLRSRAGSLWLGLSRGAVACLGDGKAKVFTVADGLADLQVRQLLEAEDGTLWVLFQGGMCNLIRGGASWM
jgi:ligand-binding sensor domain-containing protein